MYAAIKSQEIRQPAGFQLPSSQMSSLAPNTPYNALMHRSQRGQDRMTMLKRGIQTLLGQQAGISSYSSNSNIEGRDPRDGRVSPSPSFATSIDVSAAAFRVLCRRFMVLRHVRAGYVCNEHIFYSGSGICMQPFAYDYTGGGRCAESC